MKQFLVALLFATSIYAQQKPVQMMKDSATNPNTYLGGPLVFPQALSFSGTAGKGTFDNLNGAETAVASATTTDLGAVASDKVSITGTTTITSFGTKTAGVVREGRFTSILTLTHNSTSLILPGGSSITTAAGDRFRAYSLGSGNWLVEVYTKADGTAVVGGSGGGAPTTASFITKVAEGGLSNEFAMGGLGTGIVKNTTTTGVPSIAIASDFPTLDQNTTGSAATWTVGRTISLTGDVTATTGSFNGSANATAAATVVKVNGVLLSGLGTGIVKNTTGTGAPSIAVAGDFPTLNQSTTGSAATLTTPRAINGTNFDGSAAITVTAAAGTVTGTTLNSGVTASSLTSFGTNPSFSGAMTDTSNSLSTTLTTGFLLQNTANAALGAQQRSPMYAMAGQGWSTSGSSSMAVQFRWGVLPIQGASVPNGNYELYSKLGAAAENLRFTFSDLGNFTLTGQLIAGSGPTTLTDTVGKVNAAALNTVGIAQGGTGQVAASPAYDALQGAETTVASATTTDLGAVASDKVSITGTVTITGFGTKTAGVVREGRFTGILTLTYNATSLILPGAASITTAAGDSFRAISLGSGNWVVYAYNKANGLAVGGSGSGTVTSVSYTGGIVSVATPTTTPAFTVAGTSGGIRYFSSGTTEATTAALAANAFVIGGGAGVAPATTATGTGVVTAVGNNVNSAGGLMTLDGTKSPTNETYDASATGNVLKFKSYYPLTHPHIVDGAGAVLGTTTTAIDYGHATFSGSADELVNYVEYRFPVPQDIDTSVEVQARLQFRLTAADTGKHRYTLNTVSQADSSSATGTVGTPINLDFAGDASGASGDIESVGYTTLTGWAATMTAGRLLVVRLARDGNDGTNDTSTVASTEMGLTLVFGSSQ